jgi:GTP cyclohydrolase I
MNKSKKENSICKICKKPFKFYPSMSKGIYCSRNCRYLDHSFIIKNSYTPELKEKKRKLALENWDGNTERKKDLSELMTNKIVSVKTRDKLSDSKNPTNIMEVEFQAAKRHIIEERGAFCQRCGDEVIGFNLVIHHKNGMKWDNDYSNLLILCRSDHSKIHREIEKSSERFTGLATVENYIARILQSLGIDLNDPNFKETPLRVARMYNELFEGVKKSNEAKEILEKWFPSSQDQMILFKNKIFSLCPHHLLPVEYEVHTAYIPKGRVVGLSKIGRVCELLARKPVLQEELTIEINQQIMKYLKPHGVATMVKGRHFCMVMRGVEQVQSEVITSDVRGVFRTKPEVRAEFFSLIK